MDLWLEKLGPSDLPGTSLQVIPNGAFEEPSSLASVFLRAMGCDLFLRMAQRAGSMFDQDEARSLKLQVVDEIIEAEQAREPSEKLAATSNDNPLAVWLNYLLYHLSLTNPGRERATKIEPDPFSLSLLALDQLLKHGRPRKSDRSVSDVRALRFRVAMSFPGEKRTYVSSVVEALRPSLPPDSVFYDFDYQAQLARPNLDSLLLEIYRTRSDLIVVFVSSDYAEKHWCGLEWRAVRDMIKSKQDEQLMFVRFDDTPIEGLLSIDGYIDARTLGPTDLAEMILDRLRTAT